MNSRFPVSRFVLFAGLLLSCILALAGSRVFAQRGNPRKKTLTYAPIAQVPEKARAKTNPLDNDPEAIVAGGKLFQEHCAECHGMKAEGSKRGPSLLREPVRQATPGSLFWILSNGVIRHGMPDWSKLPAAERWQIVSFIKSLHGEVQRQAAANP
jgi:mono/diheme cytochrome c family protein